MVEQGAPHMALCPPGLVTMGATVVSPAPSDNQPSVAIHRSPQHVARVPVMGTGGKKTQDLQGTVLLHPGFKAVAAI